MTLVKLILETNALSIKLSRTSNTASILNSLWQSPGVSRIDMATKLGLDKSTVTKAVNHLLDIGMILEQPKAVSGKGGRPKMSLVFNADFGVIIGVDVNSDVLKVSVVNLLGQVIYHDMLPINTQVSIDTALIEALVPCVNTIQGLFPRILAIGIGMPGLIDPDKSQLLVSHSLNIRSSINFAPLFKRHFPYPVFIDNDANCGAWGELMQQRSLPYDHFLYVLLSTHHAREHYHQLGIGVGMILNRQLFYGEQFMAGQFNSQELIRGTEATPSVIIKEFSALAVNLCGLMSIRRIVIGGNGMSFGSELAASLRNHSDGLSGLLIAKPNIEFSLLGPQAAAMGAASMAWQKLLTAELKLAESLRLPENGNLSI
ncbi:ROK family transcriptional regulator [Enterovibrio sp. ZSDZ42]|uniref:ROK family transcriptional regulator n=1 Tax=Enterovibrio gelatinilyticus TaxID=2899819 RepID=A0ABT5R2I4_9GAMM|nr:ROK family transcriptional regulator [Enterovibrio sp. ZSDZ42]MDD1794483.1 ROK family transcriptional regulator [Enterovibrio sp. ZSDZ42]